MRLATLILPVVVLITLPAVAQEMDPGFTSPTVRAAQAPRVQDVPRTEPTATGTAPSQQLRRKRTPRASR